MTKPGLKINPKGQCPNCKIKPLVYKREPHLFCHRCCASFNPDTGEQIENWAFRAVDGGFRRRTEETELNKQFEAGT